jgi:hypothetical protein
MWCTCLQYALPASGQLQQPPPKPDLKYKLVGTVNNSVTGEPIRRALVRIQFGRERVAFTDVGGQFEFDGLPQGDAVVMAEKPGFFSEEQLGREFAAPSVQLGPDTKPVIVKLVPEGIIFGWVRDPDGEPIENLTVKMITLRIRDGHRRWDQEKRARTDGDGRFRFAELFPGRYYLETQPLFRQSFTPAARFRGRDEAYSSAFYPGTPGLETATPIEIGPGQQFEADFSLKPEPVFRVSGMTILTSASAESPNLQLLSEDGEGVWVPWQFEASTGAFQARIPRGSYSLLATQGGAQGWALSAEVPLTVAGDMAGIRLVLAPTLSIPVVVRAEATRPSHDRTGSLNRQIAPVPSVHLSPAGASLGRSDFWSSLVGDPGRQSIAIGNLSPAKYFVDVVPNGEWYVQSVQSGDIDLLRNELTVVAGVQPQPIEVVLRDDGSALTGSVTSGEGRVQASVLAIPEHGPSSQAKMVSASFDGSFAFSQLAPGDYDVIAVDHTDSLEYTNPEVMAAYLARATSVSLEPNGNRNVKLNLVEIGR